MVSEQQYIDYFTGLASKHKLIQHVPGTKDAFFFIPLTYELSEIDKAIRNTKSAPFLALDALRGSLTDSESESHIQWIDGQFTIADKVDNGNIATIRTAQNKCLQICFDMITRMKYDRKRQQLLGAAASLVFRIDKVNYDPVGPMAGNHYGYTVRFSIGCPFGYTVDSGTWLDK